MKNTYKVIWSEEALNNLKEIIDYLQEKWTEKEIKIFAQQLEKLINTIINNPELFPKSLKSDSVRKAVLTKQTTVYYQVNKDSIYLITIFVNKKDSKKLNDIIK